jgi:predicted acylesterase/phospholipase RssA
MLTWFWRGGDKGTSLLGAITAPASAAKPYGFHRVAGTSAGAIVASMLAAGYDAAAMNEIMTDLDFAQFEDENYPHLKMLAEGSGRLFHEGLFLGQFLHDWIEKVQADKNVRTWGDLRDDDPGSSLPPEQRYKLIVIVSDVSRGRMLRLPGTTISMRIPRTLARVFGPSTCTPSVLGPILPTEPGGGDAISVCDQSGALLPTLVRVLGS